MGKIEISESEAFYVRALMVRGYSELHNYLLQMRKMMDAPDWENVPGSIRDAVRGSCLHAEQLRAEAAQAVSKLPEELRFRHNWKPLDCTMDLTPYSGRLKNGDVL